MGGMREWRWEDDAECRGVDQKAFYPDLHHTGSSRAPEKNARVHCRRCPVRLDCLTAAFERNEQFGIWGGFNTKERRELRKKHRYSSQPYESLISALEREVSQ